MFLKKKSHNSQVLNHDFEISKFKVLPDVITYGHK
jgi:hypothetical protein